MQALFGVPRSFGDVRPPVTFRQRLEGPGCEKGRAARATLCLLEQNFTQGLQRQDADRFLVDARPTKRRLEHKIDSQREPIIEDLTQLNVLPFTNTADCGIGVADGFEMILCTSFIATARDA